MLSKISNLKDKLISCLLFALIVLIWTIFKFPCVFIGLFNIPCPGCGMTRAFLQFFQFKFVEAFKLNFMFWSFPVLVLYYFFDGKLFKNKWLNNGLLISIFVGFFINWILKLLAVI